MPEAAESRESRRRSVEASQESRVSPVHPEYNEDASLGDLSRLKRELEKTPPLSTEMRDLDTSVMRTAIETEMKGAAALKELDIHGNLDGVSGDKNGGGMFASRLASAEITERLKGLDPKATAEASRMALENAVKAAHEVITEQKLDRADLKQMSTTVDLVRVIKNADGTFDVPYAHAGDSRIYVFDGKTGKIRQETVDQIAANALVDIGQITPEQRDQMMNAKPEEVDSLPPKLKTFYPARNKLVSAVGSKDLMVKSGIIKGLRDGDKVLLATDGIFGGNVSEERMQEILSSGGGMKEIADEAAANAKRGAKNAEGKWVAENGFNGDDVTGSLIELGGRTDMGPGHDRTFSGTQLKAVSPEKAARMRQEDAASIDRIKRDIAGGHEEAVDVTDDVELIDADGTVELSQADLKDDADDEEPATIRKPPVKKKSLLDRLLGK